MLPEYLLYLVFTLPLSSFLSLPIKQESAKDRDCEILETKLVLGGA